MLCLNGRLCTIKCVMFDRAALYNKVDIIKLLVEYVSIQMQNYALPILLACCSYIITILLMR